MPISPERFQEVSHAFRLGVITFARDGALLYSALCEYGQKDPDIIALASQAKVGSPPHFHLLCAVHYILLEAPKEALAEYYGTITNHPKAPEDAWPVFREFALRYAEAILPLMRSREIQTTTPRRSGYLLPLMDRIAKQCVAPLNLMEIGTSAGFLLAFDSYSYDYGDAGMIRSETSDIVIHSAIINGELPGIPPIGKRIGLDLAPIVRPGLDQRRWLKATMFPEWGEGGFDSALSAVERLGIEFIAGDALAKLPAILDGVSDPICIFHSACLYYWPEEAKARLEDILLEHSRNRSLWKLGIETPNDYALRAARQASGEVPADDHPIFPVATVSRYQNGSVVREIVAECGRFGEWIEWT